MKNQSFIALKTLALYLLGFVPAIAFSQPQSKIVYPGKDGRLICIPYTPQGDVIPDFSYCGYKSGGVKIPDIPAVLTLEPGDFTSDDSKRIQNAINSVAKHTPGKHGFRGAILLKKGRYNIQQTLFLNHSGIVLRGEGNGEDGTVLVGTKPAQYSLFFIGATVKPQKDESSQQMITDDYVPSGTKIITVENAARFNVGDAVIIERPSTKEWIHAIGMDRIPAAWVRLHNVDKITLEKYRKEEGRLSEDGKLYNTTEQWQPGTKNLFFERTVAGIKGNQITLDIPLVNALQKEYGGGYIYKYTVKNRPQNIGIENLRGECTFDKNEVLLLPSMEEYFSDEKHVSQFIVFGTCENVWARKTTSRYIDHGYLTRSWSRFVTIEDCEYVDPVSILDGRRRYGYHFQGQMALVQRCYARNGRHDFVLGASVAGPNAFVDSRAEMCRSFSEPHQRWAAGCLYDNISVSGPVACLNMANRGTFGTGHGWSGAQMVLWNCQSPITMIMQPPTAQNFSIGHKALTDKWSAEKSIQSRINQINKATGSDMKYTGIPVIGNGYIEFPQEYVSPQYLYYSQLKDRLGKDAVKNVTYK
jgi:WD40 repeat protein